MRLESKILFFRTTSLLVTDIPLYKRHLYGNFSRH